MNPALAVGLGWLVLAVIVVIAAMLFLRHRAPETLRAGYTDEPAQPVRKPSPLVEPLTVVGDLLACLEFENEHAATLAREEGNLMLAARLEEYAVRVQVARQVVAERRQSAVLS